MKRWFAILPMLALGCGAAAPPEELEQTTQAAYMSRHITPSAKLIPTSCTHKVPNRAVVTRNGSRRNYTSPSGSGSFNSCTSSATTATSIQGRLLGQFLFTGDVDRIVNNFSAWVQVPNLPTNDVGQMVSWFYGARSDSGLYVGMVLQYGPSADVPASGPFQYTFYLITQHVDNTVMLSTFAWATQPGHWLYVELNQVPPSSDWHLYAQDNTVGGTHEEEFTDRGFNEGNVSYIFFDAVAGQMYDSGVTACNQYPQQDYIHAEDILDARGNNQYGWTYDGTMQPLYPATALRSSDFTFSANPSPCNFYGWGDNVYGNNFGYNEIGWVSH